MKLFQEYKKQFSLLFLGLFLVVPFIFLYAQTADDINSKIDQRNIDIDKLEQEISQYQNQLNNLGKQKDSLNGSLQQLDITRKKLIADISVTQNKIDKTNLQIQELGLQINDKQTLISNDINAITFEIKQTNESENNTFLESFLSKENFTTAWNDLENMITVREKIRETVVELKQTKGELEGIRQETISAKNELLTLQSQLSDQKKIVDQNTTEKKKLLSQTKDSETNYQKLLKDRLAKKDIFEKELLDYESQLKYILDPSKLPGSGVLSWPLDKIFITQPFGKVSTAAGLRIYASGTHNGTDFRASVGTPVMAMADGIIAGIGDTDIQCRGVSFGRFILIKYNNGLASTYGHLSLIKVKTGQQVTRGQIVAYSGSTGYATGPHLHVSLYPRDAVDLKTLPSKSCPGKVLTQPIAAINAYLDPMYYLPPYTQ